MDVRNSVEIETKFGRRSIELVEGDITSKKDQFDLLVISAFVGGYSPSRGSVIGQLLKNCDLDVSKLAESPAFDFRESLGIWISGELQNLHFQRLMCVEIIGGRLGTQDVIENVFVGAAILEAKEFRISTIALPLLGAGQQNIDPTKIMKPLFDSARRMLVHSQYLSRILIVEKDPWNLSRLDNAMDEVLDRHKAVVPRSQVIASLRVDLRDSVHTAEQLAPTNTSEIFNDLRSMVEKEDTRSYQIGIVGRRLVEFIINDLDGGRNRGADLLTRIDGLSQTGVAAWILGYMHTLRQIGNESVHERVPSLRIPQSLSEEDLAIALFCVRRLLEFWKEYRGASQRLEEKRRIEK
jgi:hypothetical protein